MSYIVFQCNQCVPFVRIIDIMCVCRLNPYQCIVFLYLLIACFLPVQAEAPDYRSDEVKQLEMDLFTLNNQGKYADSQQLILTFLENQEREEMDQFYAYLFRSYLYKRLFEYEQVFSELDKAMEIGLMGPHPEYSRTNIQHERALALFDKQRYEEAKEAMIEIQFDVQKYLNIESLSMYFMQFGYFAYLDSEYKKSDSIYNLAEHYMRQSGPCHLPIIFTKKMQLFAASGDLESREKAEKQALYYADSCQILKYSMLTFEVGKVISDESENLEAYKHYSSLYDSVADIYQTSEYLKEIAELDAKYGSRLKDREISSMAESNRRLWAFLIVVIALLGFVSLLIVKLVSSNRDLKKRKKELAELDTLNKEIFVIISHDFKEPLIGFNFLLSRLQMEKGEKSAYYQDLKTQVQMTTQVLQNLIDWASSELQFRSGGSRPVILKNRVQELLDNLEPLWAPKEIVVVNEVPDDCKWKIDPFVLEIAIRNIVVNAVKFSKKGQEVRICFKDNTLQVIDQGPGIKPSLLSQLFTTKVRSSYGTNRESGSGIGLFITSSLLKKNGFFIRAENNIGLGGTTFSIFPQV